MPKIVKCPICGREFTTAQGNKKFCSFSCREAGQKARKIKWNMNNPGYMTQYMRAYREKEKNPT